MNAIQASSILLLYIVFVNASYTTWSQYGPCSKSCDGGQQKRTRQCIADKQNVTNSTNNSVINSTFACNGSHIEFRKCNDHICPVNGRFRDWSVFGACSKSCGGGVKRRTRTCTSPGKYGLPCDGEMDQTIVCNIKACPTPTRTARWCEHRPGGRIQCPKGLGLNISHASYGRMSTAHCRFTNWSNTSCRSGTAMSKVRARCQGKPFCNLVATNTIFGDPCFGTVKYLEVRYNCQ